MSDKKCPNCGYELDSWNDCVSVNNILECPECEEHFELKAVTLNEPQLTIPKSIADEVEDNGLDSYSIHSSLPKDSYLIPEWEPLVDLSEKLMKWCEETEKWWAILDAYLAGKGLGVDLVKVVEG